MGRKKGISDEELLALPNFGASELFSPREKVALEFAEEVTKTPVEVPDELFARLREHFTEDQVVELAASIAFENYRTRLYHALEIGSDGFYACALPPRPQAGGQAR